MKLFIAAILISLSAFAANEKKPARNQVKSFEERKATMIDMLKSRKAAVETSLTCVEGAKDTAALRECGKTLRADRNSMREKMKTARAERLEKRKALRSSKMKKAQP